MDNELQNQMLAVIKSIYSSIPDGTDLYNVEDKLDKLISLQEKQINISEQILEKLEQVVDNSDRSTDYLSDISSNTKNM